MLIMMFMLMMLMMMMKLEQVPTFCTSKAWTLKQTSNRAARPHFPHTVKYVGPLNLEPSSPAWFLSQRCVQVHITCTYNTRLARTCRASRPFPTCALTRVHTQYTRAYTEHAPTTHSWRARAHTHTRTHSHAHNTHTHAMNARIGARGCM